MGLGCVQLDCVQLDCVRLDSVRLGGGGPNPGRAAYVPVAREHLLWDFGGLVLRVQLEVQLDDGLLQQIESDRPSTYWIVAAVAKAGHVGCQAEPCNGRVRLFTMGLTSQLNVTALSRWRCTAFRGWFCLK